MNEHGEMIERFVNTCCYDDLQQGVNAWLAHFPSGIRLNRARRIIPTSAFLDGPVIESVATSYVSGDDLQIQLVVSGNLTVIEDSGWGTVKASDLETLIVCCTVTIEDTVKIFQVTSVSNYNGNCHNNFSGVKVDKNAVPLIDPEDEATSFLKEYCPEALDKPMPVPIADIIQNQMHLDLFTGYQLGDDAEILGQICFSKCDVVVSDFFTNETRTVSAERGTIFANIRTSINRNTGAENNTLAHEAYHWYRHRVYAAMYQMLSGNAAVAHRCPATIVYPGRNEKWTDEQRMEWQANNVAPKILMPVAPFRQKTKELCEKYSYHPEGHDYANLQQIANELAEFFGVSRQSALIRLKELDHPEADKLLESYRQNDITYFITPEEAFLVYMTNSRFREILLSGAYVYCPTDTCYVLDNPRYVDSSAHGVPEVTEYGWYHAEECILAFKKIHSRPASHSERFLNLYRSGGYYKEFYEDDYANWRQQDPEGAFMQCLSDIKIIRKADKFGEALRNLCDNRGITAGKFEKMTNVHQTYFSRYTRTDSDPTVPSKNITIAICIGLGLTPDASEQLMHLAGHAFDRSDQDQAYQFCIVTYPYDVNKSNAFLRGLEFKEVGSIPNSGGYNY